jgi:RNA polymerase sigma-32 factor
MKEIPMGALSDGDRAIAHNRRYISQAMQVPLLAAEHETELARRWRRGDEKALHELVTAHLRLVVAIAGRYRSYGLMLGDLVQEGNVGLMLAAARFDPERQVRFSTYASWWIRSAIQEFILRNWSIVRAGTSAAQKALFFNLRWLKARIERDGEARLDAAAMARIAQALKVSPREVEAMANRLAGLDQSLNEPVGDEGSDQWLDFLADSRANPEEEVMARHDLAVRRAWLAAALRDLTPRERHIVRARVLADDRLTLEELGGELGITKERVRQIEHKAIAKLRATVLRFAAVAPAASAA